MPDLLEMRGLTAGYSGTTVLEDISFAMEAGSVLALLGKNGVGKSTLLATVMGLTRVLSGEVAFMGKRLNDLPTYARASLGVGYVPQEREIFQSLTVEENIRIAARPGEWTLHTLYELLPRLHERRRNYGNQLSGGEQQMLALARALVSNPSLLMLDEPFEGLAPVIVDQLIDALEKIRGEGMPMILVEHHADLALNFADVGMVLDRGRVVWHGPSAELLSDEERLSQLVGLAMVSDGHDISDKPA